MDGWGGLLLMILLQAMMDCEGKGRRLSRPVDQETRQEAEAWLRDGQCEDIREVLGGEWANYTPEELVARAHSGEINWASVAKTRRDYWMAA